MTILINKKYKNYKILAIKDFYSFSLPIGGGRGQGSHIPEFFKKLKK
jgi:hypothetical protein